MTSKYFKHLVIIGTMIYFLCTLINDSTHELYYKYYEIEPTHYDDLVFVIVLLCYPIYKWIRRFHYLTLKDLSKWQEDKMLEYNFILDKDDKHIRKIYVREATSWFNFFWNEINIVDVLPYNAKSSHAEQFAKSCMFSGQLKEHMIKKQTENHRAIEDEKVDFNSIMVVIGMSILLILLMYFAPMYS